jgi:hypothetical protein
LLTVAIALLTLVQAPQQDTSDGVKLSPSQIMAKMFEHYSSAKTISGSIKMTQTALNQVLHIQTDLQFDRPNLIYLHQVRDGAHQNQWFLTSDGKEFSYDRPGDLDPGLRKRFVEYAKQHDTSLTLGDFLVAASHSVGDLNAMVESAIASTTALKKLTAQWATLVYRGRFTLDGKSVSGMSGQFRQSAISPVTGDFEAYINDDGDFVKYVLHQRFGFPEVSKQPIDVTTVWESTLKVNAATNPTLYKVIL